MHTKPLFYNACNILCLQVLYQVHYKLSTLNYRGVIDVGIVHLDGQLPHQTSNKHHHHGGSVLILQWHGYGKYARPTPGCLFVRGWVGVGDTKGFYLIMPNC
jgi:hypothetical protein